MNSTLGDQMLSILSAATGTLQLVFWSLVISTIIGALLTPVAVRKNIWVRLPIMVYSWIGRALPPLTLLIGFYFGFIYAGIRLPGMTAAIIAFVFLNAAYTVEIFRAGYLAVPKGQFEGVKALGLPPWRAQLGIIAPQVLRVSTPALITNATTVLKDSALASVIGVMEMTAQTQRIVQSAPGHAIILYSYLAVLYIVLCSGLFILQHYLEKRLKVHRRPQALRRKP
ncbi:amino acid ABC transporter permease [Nesterenkonia ebinurensis]|uniref:amino acid ABC transporter permease n=1 Tax=Nesterenkonia ebinurensis TaxID=2608252 RepID=UPI00123CCC30|nr:amino acid ABC transporter permease [Nesterenkonia ebinurensis]